MFETPSAQLRCCGDESELRARITVAHVADPNALAIFGAGPGLGSALARRFARAGWSIALVARRADVLDAGLAELAPFGVNTCGVQADVTDRSGVERAVQEIVHAVGVPDVVTYNASIYQGEGALDLSNEALRLALDIHVVGALNTAQCAVAAMQQAGHGVLVFTVNSLARSPEAMSAALSIGKGGQLNLALSLERELDGTAIRVGVVTVCGPISAGTAYDPDRLADVYWELATQDPAAFERDRVVQAG